MDENAENLPEIVSKIDTIADLGAFVSSAVPMIGGPVSNLLSGFSTGRKFERVRDALVEISENLMNFESKVSAEYVKTEDFEEILEKTLRQVGEERTEEKRRIYKDFLITAVKSPGESYEEQIRLLRTLEEIQPDHIRVLRAIRQPPAPNPPDMSSPLRTLDARLPELERERISELVGELNNLRVTDFTALGMNMTGQGAENLQGRITKLGSAIIRYIED